LAGACGWGFAGAQSILRVLDASMALGTQQHEQSLRIPPS
jgi:hypothetical protein